MNRFTFVITLLLIICCAFGLQNEFQIKSETLKPKKAGEYELHKLELENKRLKFCATEKQRRIKIDELVGNIIPSQIADTQTKIQDLKDEMSHLKEQVKFLLQEIENLKSNNENMIRNSDVTEQKELTTLTTTQLETVSSLESEFVNVELLKENSNLNETDQVIQSAEEDYIESEHNQSIVWDSIYSKMHCYNETGNTFYFQANGGYLRSVNKWKLNANTLLSFKIKPRSKLGNLMTITCPETLLALRMVDCDNIKLTVINGQNVAIKTSTNLQLCDNNWHQISGLVGHSFVTVYVDNEDVKYVGRGFHYTEPDGDCIIFLGNQNTHVDQYVGCMKDVQIHTPGGSGNLSPSFFQSNL